MLIPPRAARVISSPGTRSDMDWRKIEQALIEIARQSGHEVDEAHNGDKGLVFTDDGQIDINLTDLAKELAERLA